MEVSEKPEFIAISLFSYQIFVKWRMFLKKENQKLRWKYLILPDFQIRYLWKLFIPILFQIGICVLCISWVSLRWDSLPLNTRENGIVLVSIFSILVTIFNILLFIVFGILHSHSFAGPLVKIYKVLDEVIQGREYTKLHLRKNDEMSILAKKLNRIFLRS